MDFLDKDNKALLWGILQENNAFNGLSNDKFSDIQKQFENIRNTIICDDECIEGLVQNISKNLNTILNSKKDFNYIKLKDIILKIAN